ncbi:MAG: DUF1801 domain-containing protein [Flavisolibacter sp.]|nr:DUF1801 domain-containing protein [Flavisolibacter sp.]
MPTYDPRIDAYIDKSASFAQPILTHLRDLVHQACPDVEETMKWSMPHFDYKGVMCSMASFKQHCSVSFWKAFLLNDPKGYIKERAAQGGEGMGHLGRITSLKDLPPDKVLIDLIKQAKRLNDEGVKLPSKEKKAPKELATPDYFLNELKKNKSALAVFENFSPSQKKEYVQWITEAKSEDTRNKRMATALEWIAEGKKRNWKYEVKK